MLRSFFRKRIAVALTAIAALALAAGAYAYFSSNGSGTGHATVGTSTAFTVTPSAYAGTIYPDNGASSATFSFKVTNPGSGTQNLNTTTASIAADGSGNVLNAANADAPVANCSASWFHASVTQQPSLGELAPGATTANAGSVKVTMDDVNSSQDACKGVQPEVTVSAS
jgi:hypothetical protein